MNALRTLVFSLCALCCGATSLFAQSDPMAKWKPRVGDIFHYHYMHIEAHWHHGQQLKGGSWEGEFSDTITSVDSSLDTIRTSVVIARRSGAPSIYWYWFHVSGDTSSLHPLAIESTIGDFDFSKSQITQALFDGDSISLYDGSYSPDLRWFYSWSNGYDNVNYEGSGAEGDENITHYWLMSASQAIVLSKDRTDSYLNVRTDGKFITLSISSSKPNFYILLDPLGRPVRSWQMPVEAGERRITLNVADVPSGVYFLRVSGGGVDEVKRVCITH
jgi:hypothetical protein